MRLLAVLAAMGLWACGGAPEVKGPTTCDLGKRLLKARVGPEMDSVVLAEPTPISEEGERAGCAMIYVQHGEELPEELPEGELPQGGASDQRLAFALYGPNGKLQVSVVNPVPDAPSSVMLSISTRDVTGDNRPDLIVQEDGIVPGANSYRGLRIFSTAPGQPKPRDLFSQRLLVKTAEGLEMLPTWRTGDVGGTRGIFFEGAGTWKVFTWNPDAKVFVFDKKATDAKNPKPVAAPTPTAPDATAVPGATALPAAASDPILLPETGKDGKPTMPDLNLP